MRRWRKMSRTGGLPVERVDAHRPAAEAARRRRRRRSTCTRRSAAAEEHQEAVVVLAQDVAGRARHATRGGSRRRGSRLRAQVERAEAREDLARQRARRWPARRTCVVTSSALERRAPPSTSARSRVTGHHQRAVRPRRGAAAPSSCGPRDLELAQVRDVGPGDRGVGRARRGRRRRRSSRRAPPTARRRRSAWRSIGLRATRGAATARRGTRSAHERSTSPSGS